GLRVRTRLDDDAELTMRHLARSQRILVAGPSLASRLAETRDIAALATMPTLGGAEESGDEVVWTLVGPGGEQRSVRHEPQLAVNDFLALREVAKAGL